MISYYNAIVDRRSVDLRDVGLFAARWSEQAWHIAVVLHAGLHGSQAHTQSLTLETAENAVRLANWFSFQQLSILAKGRRAASRKVEDEVLELSAETFDRRHQDYITARDVQRARITSTPEAARSLLARLEAEGVLVGEDVSPQGGGKVTRIFRRTSERNPIPE